MIGAGKPKTGRPKKGNYREGRDRKLCIRLTTKDLKRLETVCKIYYISKSDFIIGAIADAFKEVRRMNGD